MDFKLTQQQRELLTQQFHLLKIDMNLKNTNLVQVD